MGPHVMAPYIVTANSTVGDRKRTFHPALSLPDALAALLKSPILFPGPSEARESNHACQQRGCGCDHCP